MKIELLQPTLPTDVIPVIPDKKIAEIPQLKRCLVMVYPRPNLRRDTWETHRGFHILSQLFEEEEPKIDTTIKEVDLHFPERWINIVEQYALFYRIGRYFPHIEELVIKTHSVSIIQCMRKEYIRVMTRGEMMDGPDGKLYH
jgi:hypothetical protein